MGGHTIDLFCSQPALLYPGIKFDVLGIGRALMEM